MAVDRAKFKSRLLSGEPVLAPLCLDPLIARLCERLGFEAGYVSGGALGFLLGVSEGLLTMTEVAATTAAITKRSDLPMIVDIAVGFGDPVHVIRTIRELEAVGAAAVELEDQVAPKRVSHARGKDKIISTEEMVDKIRCAVVARQDPNLVLIVRCNAIALEGFEAAIDRCHAYANAGADLLLLLPTTDDEWRTAPRRVPKPVVCFETLDTRSTQEWSELGWSLILDAITGQTLPYETVKSAYQRQLAGQGSGRSADEMWALYFDLQVTAGLEELYEIEAATTLRDEA